MNRSVCLRDDFANVFPRLGRQNFRIPVPDHADDEFPAAIDFKQIKESLLVMFAAAGFISIITTSAALIIDVFAISTESFGYIFALSGIGILAGSSLNRKFLRRFDTIQMTGVGAAVI